MSPKPSEILNTRFMTVNELPTILGLKHDVDSVCQYGQDGARCKNTLSRVFHDRALQLLQLLAQQLTRPEDAEDILDEFALVTHCKRLHRQAGFDKASQWLAAIQGHTGTLARIRPPQHLDDSSTTRGSHHITNEVDIVEPTPKIMEPEISAGIKHRATDFLPPEVLATTIPEPNDPADLVSFDSLDAKIIRDNTKTNCIAICVSNGSAGQRCWKKLSKQCRNAAADLLAITRSQYQQGLDYEGELEKLATNLLCTKAKHHRKQAKEIALRWTDELTASLEDSDSEDEEDVVLEHCDTRADSQTIDMPAAKAESRCSRSPSSFCFFSSPQLHRARHETSTPAAKSRRRNDTPLSTVSSIFTPNVNSSAATPATSPQTPVPKNARLAEVSPTRQAVERRLTRLRAEATSLERVSDNQTQGSGESLSLKEPQLPKPAFFPLRTIPSNAAAILDKIIELMGKPLLPSDAPGYVYSFSRASSPRLLKIGRTTGTVSVRVGKQGQKCRYLGDISVIEDTGQRKTDWQHRLESLVHMELAHLRRKETSCNYGKGCRKVHREWFETDKDQVLETVERWRKWLEFEPYDAGSKVLREYWASRLGSLRSIHTLTSNWNDTMERWLEGHCAKHKDILRTQDIVQDVEAKIERHEQAVKDEKEVIKTVVDALEDDVVVKQENGELPVSLGKLFPSLNGIAAGPALRGGTTGSTVRVAA
ncbi:MAG: hypothetical protein MMC23_009197 [Stictis urceolatum]|nr:hypothetical protein [Stictis urceolata]